jgi:CBS-domain-containing membrane protein
MSTPVIQVINMFVEQNISAVPIVDSNGVVLNVYETIDAMVSVLFLSSVNKRVTTINCKNRALLDQVDTKN